MRSICFVTGSRAEYGLLHPVMAEAAAAPGLDSQILVTGTHLDPRFGETVREIEADGIRVKARVPLDLSNDSALGVSRALAQAIEGTAEAYASLSPDLVVVLGDRFEILGAVQAAVLARIPVAHIHGGEATHGALDDVLRHAVTKLAHYHFTAAEPYRRRIIQMGEDPARVFNVGALAGDNLRLIEKMSRSDLEADLELSLDDPFYLVTYHPATANPDEDAAGLDAMLRAFDVLPEARIIFTGVNADAGNEPIARRIRDWVENNPARARGVQSLGRRRYLSALCLATAVVGNSSSGIIEAPIAGVPTVNIGTRQDGRLRAASIIDCRPDVKDVLNGLARVRQPAFRARMGETAPPYGDGRAAGRIVGTIAHLPVGPAQPKPFHDIGGES